MSNMVVRTNVFALNSHRNLTNVGLQQRQSAQRLSSGFRVNSAADDAAGLAISESMRAQIRGLDQASVNTQDGVGLIQTAEGAMATISDMVIRVRELMVQAANDTNTFNNREMIQLEIDQIMTEINDVTFRTQFNTRTLLAGGLGGEGGGPSSPVSLQWMVFDQARLIGLAQPGGIVTTTPAQGSRNDIVGRMPNVHYNSRSRTETSARSEVISLQNDLNALARRIAERMVADPNSDFDANDLSAAFEDVRNLNFEELSLLPTERTELQSIANRIESIMRNALRAAEEVFQITQDQMNALGGEGAVNFDGSSVFNGPAVGEWTDELEGARTVLENIRATFNEVVGTDLPFSLEHAMAQGEGPGGAIVWMQTVVDRLVGQIGAANVTTDNPAYTAWIEANQVPNPAYLYIPGLGYVDSGAVTVTTEVPTIDDLNNPNMVVNPALEEIDGNLGWIDPSLYDFVDEDDRSEIDDPDYFQVFQVDGDTLVGYIRLDMILPDDPGALATQVHDSDGNPLGWVLDADIEDAHPQIPDPAYTYVPGFGYTLSTDLTIHATNETPDGTYAQIPDETAMYSPHPELDGWFVPGHYEFFEEQPTMLDPTAGPNPHDPTIVTNNSALPPINAFFYHLETLLDMSTDVLGNVNLESNAMWFQIGPNEMQGMILQLKGIHTGILGGGRGDLAMLIDVRERSGMPISEQLEIIDIAEGIVNGQRAQLGAVQNRLEFTRQSLDISSENLSAAESRIRDTDMAREMMRFTQAQVLQQAGISMLAQANQLPASILQLLQ